MPEIATLTLAQLLQRDCRPLEGGRSLPPEAVRAQLAVLDGWGLRDNHIVKTYRFNDYHATIAFVNAVAFVVNRQDHHPELMVGYNRCEVRFSTHSVDGISENDFICAAKIDALAAGRFAGPPA